MILGIVILVILNCSALISNGEEGGGDCADQIGKKFLVSGEEHIACEIIDAMQLLIYKQERNWAVCQWYPICEPYQDTMCCFQFEKVYKGEDQ